MFTLKLQTLEHISLVWQYGIIALGFFAGILFAIIFAIAFNHRV